MKNKSMRKWAIPLAVAVVVIVGFAVLPRDHKTPTPEPGRLDFWAPLEKGVSYNLDIETPGGTQVARYAIEAVNTPRERAQGLKGRESMPQNEGMLFIMKGAGEHQFWNKGVLFPIDIIFADAYGKIVQIHSNVPPCPEEASDCPLYSARQETQYILELNGGVAEKAGVENGMRFSSPEIRLNP